MPNVINPQDADLAKYFTDVEPLRDWFDKAVAAETVPKRLLVIWGVGGIGKSSLLRMFRYHCKQVHVPVALASGDESKSVVDLLARWAEDLKTDGVNFSTFFKTYDHYRAIQAEVADKASEARKKWGDVAGKAAGKAAEAGAAAAVGAVVGSVIPGIGTVAGAVGGMGAEALVDWLRSFLTKSDIDLYTDPTKKLTDDFLFDVDKLASKQRVVLMLDTYEQLTTLDHWTRDVAQRLNRHILMVIAGRAMLNWGRQWPEWLMYAQVEELKPMTKRVMHELIRRYYATMRGGEPSPKQVQDIIEFSGGLPMVVNTAVQLWVKYQVEDFGAVKGEVVRDVVQRLREGVPAELFPLLETAAALRYFNKEILRAVSGMADISAEYDELRRFPFVRARAEGYALHDRVREMIEENARTDDPAIYRARHERGAAYFEARLAQVFGEQIEPLRLEQLFHRVCADEEIGIKLFQKIAEEFVRYKLRNRLRALLNDVDSYHLEGENGKLWLKYYHARLSHMELQFDLAERTYQNLGENERADRKLRAYALCDWGGFLSRYERLGNEEGLNKARKVLRESLESVHLDFHLTESLFKLADVARYEGNWGEVNRYLEKVREFFESAGDNYGLVIVYSQMKRANGVQGLWKNYSYCHKQGVSALNRISPQPVVLKATLFGRWSGPWTLTGRFAEFEKHARESLAITRELEDEVASLHILGDLGWVLGLQGKFDEAENCFLEVQNFFEQQKKKNRMGNALVTEEGSKLGFWGLVLIHRGFFDQAEVKLKQSLGIKKTLHDKFGLLEIVYWLGLLEEVQQHLEIAEAYFRECSEWKWYGRLYFNSASITSLTRVKLAQSDYVTIPPLLTEAEQLAQQYEYNDHLASLRLTQAHIAWDGHIPEWGKGFEPAFEFYKLALVYALRYNRFLLDEALSGRHQGTPLGPIIPGCLNRNEVGRKMLSALREWWLTGKNDVGAPRPDTISPIPENIPLLEAEEIAREREPGDGSPQKTVIEQIDAALA